MLWGNRSQFSGRTMSKESDSFPKQTMLGRLLDIISGHNKELPYFYSPARQLHEAYAKLGIVTQLQVAVQKGGC